MLRLRTLGGLSIDGAKRPLRGAALQRRRLALLAVVAGPQSISRDKLIGLFWPESDEERARHALAQSLHALRRALEVDDLFLGSQELRLNPGVVEVDRWTFERVLTAGELERAVAAYTGPFLDGVYLDDAPAFERWVESERARLAQLYMSALETLASAAEAGGDTLGAVTWMRRLVTADPFGAGPALGFMRALAASGDTAAALQHARVHEALLSSELDVAPAPDVAAFVQRLRDAAVVVARSKASAAAAEKRATAALEQPPESSNGTSGPNADGEPHAPSDAERTKRPQRRTVPALVAGTVLVFALVGVAASVRVNGRAQPRAPAVNRDRVAVFPFSVRGDSSGVYLGTGMVDVLGMALDGAGELRTVDPRALLSRVAREPASSADPARATQVAADFGAGLFVLGDVTELDGRVQVTASLYDAAKSGMPIGKASASGSHTDVFDVVDRVAAQLLAERSDAPADRLARVAAVTTSSLPALKAYLTGEQELRAWNFAQALDAFQRAVALDTAFALAYYRLSTAADWMGRGDLTEWAAARAVRHGERLSPHDRLLAEALLAWRRNDAEDAERRYRAVLLRYPDDVETWYQLGEVYFHDNPGRGRSFAEAGIPFERALALEPDSKETMVHLMRIAAWEERWDTVAALVHRMDPRGEDPHLGPYRALATRDPAAVTRALEALRFIDGGSLIVSAMRLALYTRRLDVAARVFELLADPNRPAEERALAHHSLAFLAAARGQMHRSRAHVDSVFALRPHYALDARARLALAPLSPYPTRELAALRDTLLRWRNVPVDTTARRVPFDFAPAEYPMRFTAAAGLLAARLGDSTAAREAATAVAEHGMHTSATIREWRRGRAALLRAEVLRIAGRPADALVALGHVRPPDGYGTREDERILLAQLLSAAGRLPEAVRWFGSVEQTNLQSLPWAAPAHLARAELLERMARPDEALAEYGRVVELLRDCDPELRPTLEEARRRAAQLHGAPRAQRLGTR